MLHGLNFDNAQAVRDAHAAITKLPALTQWYDQAFRDGEKTESLSCVATLILHQAAETQGRSSAHIPGSRQQALARLSPQLSPTRKTALLLTVEGHPAASEFAQYFAASDRCSLAAQACRTEAETTRDRGTYVRAAQHFAKLALTHESVAHAHTQQQHHEQAAEANLAAAQALLKAGAHEHAARTFTMGANAYAAARQHALAQATYIEAAHASLAAAQTQQKAGEHERVAHTLMTGARAYAAAGQREHAQATYREAAQVSLAAGQTQQKAGEHVRAAHTLLIGAQAYAGAGQHELAHATYAQAVEVHEALAQAHAQAGKPALAAAAHQAGAEIWIKIAINYEKQCQPCQAGDAFVKTAECYAQAGQPAESSKILNTAMTAYHGAGEHMLAARVAEQYAQFNLAAGRNSLVIAGVLCMANAHAKGGRRTLAALGYVEAAELEKAAQSFERVDPTLASATRRSQHLFREVLATQTPNSVIAQIHATLSPHAPALQAGGILHAGRHTLTYGPAEFTGQAVFSSTVVEEWCLLARDATLSNLEVVRLSVLAEQIPLNARAPDGFTRVPAEQLVRGKDALALLRAVSKLVPAPTSQPQSALSVN